MDVVKTDPTHRFARARGAAFALGVALVLAVAPVATAQAATAADGAQLGYSVASTLAGRQDALVDVTADALIQTDVVLASNASGVVLTASSEVTPLESGVRTTYVVHRYLQTAEGSRYVEDVQAGLWPAHIAGVSGAPISVQLDDDPQAVRRVGLAGSVEGFDAFVAEGNTYVTDGTLPTDAEGTVGRPFASFADAAPVVAAGGETHVHLFYTRTSYQLRLVAGEGVSSVAASGSSETSSDLTVAVRYGRPVAVSAALEGGYEDVRWEVVSGEAKIEVGEDGAAVLAAMPAGAVTLEASASRAEYQVRLMGEGTLLRPGSELDGVALADERLEGVYTYRTGTDLVLPALAPRYGRSFEGWAVAGHVEGAEPRIEQRTQLVDGVEQPYWVFVGAESFGDVVLTALWDSQWNTLALVPAPAGVELSSIEGVVSGQARSIAVLSGVGVFRSDESSLESERIDTETGNWLTDAELPARLYTVAYDPAGGTIAEHAVGEVVEDTHEIEFVGYEGSVVADGAAHRALLIAVEERNGSRVGRVTDALDVNNMAGADSVLTGVWNEAADAFVLPEVSRLGYTFAGWYEDGVRRDLGTTRLVPSKVRTELVARWSPVTYRVTYGNLDGALTGDAVLDGGARLALPVADTVPGGGTGGHTAYTVQSGSWVLPEPSAAEAPEGYEFAGYILDVEDGALEQRLSSATGVVLAPVTHDGEGRHGGATIGATSHANVRATATWRPVRFTVTLAAEGATSPAEVTTVYGQFGSKELYLERPASASSALEGPLAVEPLSGKVLDIPARAYSVSYASGVEDNAGVSGVPGAASVARSFTGYWYTGADGVARRIIRVESQGDGTLVGVLDDTPFEDVAEGQPRSARELVASWTGNVTLEGRWADGGAVALPAPSREGWAFDGWLLGGEGVDARVLAGGKDASFVPTGSTSALTLTAQWSSGPFSIVYDVPSDAVLSAALPSRYGDGDAFDLPTPARDGYRFVGWYGGLAAERDDEVERATPSPTMTIDYPAGDLWFATAWEPLTYHIWLAMPASETALVAGTAEGWTAVSGADRAELAAPAGRGVLDVAEGKEALSEVLEAATAGTESRLGTLAETAKFVTAWQRSYTVEDAVKLPQPVKAGYTFAGWDVRLAAVDAAGKPTDATAVSGKLVAAITGECEVTVGAGGWGDVVATPMWRRNTYRVSFDAGAPLGASEAVFAGEDGAATHGAAAMDASAFVASYDVSYELPESLYERQHSVSFNANVPAAEEATVVAPDAVTGTWTFAGWRLPDGSVHAPGEQVRNLVSEGNAVVTATWNATGKVTLPAGPARAGWLFVGWSENPDGAGTLLSAGSTYAPERNTTLYAVWERGYRVIYDLAAPADALLEWVLPGTGLPAVAADAARYEAEAGWPNPATLSAAQLSAGNAVTLYSPSIEGWHFLGWFEDGIDLGGVDAPAVLSEASDHVLRARWKAETGQVVFKAKDFTDSYAMVSFASVLKDGTELIGRTIPMHENLEDFSINANGELVSRPRTLLAGEYEFSLSPTSDGTSFKGEVSGEASEKVVLEEGDVVTVEFDSIATTKLSYEDLSMALSSIKVASLSAEEQEALHWLKVCARLNYIEGTGVQEYIYPIHGSNINIGTNGSLVTPDTMVMRFPHSMTNEEITSSTFNLTSTGISDRLN